jgi:hypothetical protein
MPRFREMMQSRMLSAGRPVALDFQESIADKTD